MGSRSIASSYKVLSTYPPVTRRTYRHGGPLLRGYPPRVGCYRLCHHLWVHSQMKPLFRISPNNGLQYFEVYTSHERMGELEIISRARRKASGSPDLEPACIRGALERPCCEREYWPWFWRWQ